jgi:uncharacterized protein YihD (DUF1040 family)
MQNHRIDEVLNLLKPNWLKNKELSFLELIALIKEESGFQQPISDLNDDTIISHLKAVQTQSKETVHLVDEVLELLAPYWLKNSELSLLQLLALLKKESGFAPPLEKLTDEVIIYQLKMDQTAQGDMIPGIQKDFEDDFQTALLKARGLL